MRIKSEFKTLLKVLSQDPKVREAINTLGRMGNKNFAVLPQAIGTGLLIAGKAFGKGRLRNVAAIVDAVVFLISLSLLIKQNVFDRPEVQEFMRKMWSDISRTAHHLNDMIRDYVDKRLSIRRSRKS